MTTRRIERLLFVLAQAAMLVGAGGGSVAQPRDPRADRGAIVEDTHVRFTVLTPRLIRMEWSPLGSFEDRASLVFLNRKLPVPRFTVDSAGSQVVIHTDGVVLRYTRGSGRFSGENLSAEFSVGGRSVTWRPGMPDTANLRGTIRTLDGVEGATPLEPGLLSRDGWVVVDDSERPLFDQAEWPWVTARPEGERQDWYLFAYGRSYKEQLRDFTSVAGRIPLPPRFAFGIWWSRYWGYTDSELMDLVREFELHSVPLDVLVVDMDWHLTFDMRWDRPVKDQAGQQLGWTGYTWERNFFPDPPAFLAWCESRGVKTPLNLHPASGVQPHEEQYPAMARSMGVDPSTQAYIPFDITDRRFAEHYLDAVIRPLELQGVDFWWLDWQQWGSTRIPGVTPTFWLNYVFFTDMERKKGPRPILFHRWGGLGNHRYQIGFSGDAVSVWSSLAFQPCFTATAANVGFGYWSHDIGGHMPGPIGPELYTRWIQFGVFSPILRTHTTKNPEAERRIWAYPNEYYRVMRDAFWLRQALTPYIYTEARKTYETGVSIVRPMYYEYPETDEAYAHPGQYCFGDAMIAAPVAEPMSAESLLAKQTVWLPPGEWVEWFTGARLKGPGRHTRTFAIDEVPVYVRSGSIVPMQPRMAHGEERPLDPLVLTVFPGDSGSVELYEDQGNSLGYQNDEYARTVIRQQSDKSGHRAITIQPVRGTYPGMPPGRSYRIRLEGTLPPASVRVNGTVVSLATEGTVPAWWYEGETATTVIALPPTQRSRPIKVVVRTHPGGDEAAAGARGCIARLNRVMGLANAHWPTEWSPPSLIEAAQVGRRMSLRPGTAADELSALRAKMTNALRDVDAQRFPEDVKRRIRAHLAGFLHQ